MTYELSVYYDLQKDENSFVFRDDEIEELAGSKIVSAGCGMACYVRDVQLRFANEVDLERAKSELREAGFRFAAMCEVHPDE